MGALGSVSDEHAEMNRNVMSKMKDNFFIIRIFD